MKSDLDSLMQERNIDALLITGPAQHNPPMVYMTGGGHLTQADLIKIRGEDPILFFNPMERDEAAKTGLKTKNLADYKFRELLKQMSGDMQRALVARYQKMFTEYGLTSGRLAVYGQQDAGYAYALLSKLEQAFPDLTIFGEVGDSVLLAAMATKDQQEVERIRQMGKITVEVVEKVADFLTTRPVKDGILLAADGAPVTVGMVKNHINLWLAERGAENPEGTIFAMGRDAGVPHSAGAATDALRLGETIVFDIFPCEAGGGYFYDFTRTWCLGYAPEPAQQLHEQVLQVYNQIISELQVNARCDRYQKRTCELFEGQGHPTVNNDPQTESGYVHGLGHGLGLHVHERPLFGQGATENDRLTPGVVVTIEPGLYYPERGLGVRLEDTLWARPDGTFEILADYPKDLVLPVKNT
jgi:Xaa-Pro aminopeptidase